MTAMPSVFAMAGVMCRTTWPPTVNVPASGVSAPATILMSVDFPAPFSPTSACTSPARRSNETPLSARTPLNVLEIESARSNTPGLCGNSLSGRGDACVAPTCRWLTLPVDAERQRHDPRIVSGRDDADVRVRDVRGRIAEVDPVEQVEDLAAEVDARR